MEEILSCLGLLILLVTLLATISLLTPRTSWRLFESWQYKNYEYHEPSGCMLFSYRLGGCLVLVVLAVLAWLIFNGLSLIANLGGV